MLPEIGGKAIRQQYGRLFAILEAHETGSLPRESARKQPGCHLAERCSSDRRADHRLQTGSSKRAGAGLGIGAGTAV
jgi:hypothetical protein